MSTRSRGGAARGDLCVVLCLGAVSSPNYITPEGARRLSEELGRLRTVERPKTVQEVADAAAQGDRSENAEYIYGKRRLREIDKRLEFLAKRLDRLQVFHPPAKPPEKVTFGAWVTLEDEDGGEVHYQLVGPDEFDVALGKISVASPVGRALLGKEEGDDVVVDRPRGRTTFTLMAISYKRPPGAPTPENKA